MFPFIGIMADQEPKRAFTASGSYPMGLFQSGDSIDVTADITGTSDFTFMIWAYPTTANQYIFKTSDNTAFLQIKSDGKLRFQILNANATNSVVESASAISLNTLQMITVTGNTTNGLNLYINDTLNNSGSMPANNNVAGKTWQLGTNFDGSLALFRSWSKELALADVGAHYAYDEGLLLQGGVAVSAMTTDQKTSLEFAVEMIEDIPYDSDEFDDRSTNKYAVTNNGVTLTGQSLQVYTDANDIPVVGGVNDFALNVAELNGSSQYFTLADSADWDFSGDFSVSIRFKANSLNVQGTLWIHHEDSSNFMYVLLDASNNFDFYWYEGSLISRITVPSGISVGDWNTLTISRIGSTITLYKNDTALGTGTSSATPNIAGLMYVGAMGLLGGSHFDGSLYEFVVWNGTGLTQANVTTLHNNGSPICYNDSTLQTNMKTYLRLGNFNGNNGSELTDQTGNGNNATNIGSTPFNPTGALIVSDGGTQYNTAFADLNGSTQYFTAGSQFSPTSVSSFSYVVWFKTSTSAQGQMYSSTFEGTGADHWVAVNSTLTGTNKLGFGANDGGAWTASNYVASTSNVNDGQWHLGVGVYDNTANELKIYIDGVLEATTTTVPTPLFSASMLSAVGRYAPSAVAYYDGEMAFVGHAHQALTAGQITTIYNNGVPLCYADLGVTLDGFYNLSNYNGNNGSELTDQVGSNDLTNVGSTPFTGTGLIVECT